MPVRVNAIANCDDAVIFWRAESRIRNCLGFAIEREKRLPDGSVLSTFLENRAGFGRDNPRPGQVRPSTEWPFQRFSWTDHSVNSGDTARYRITPMVLDGGALQQRTSERSGWTPWMTLSGDAGDSTSAFFNRGLIISQFMSRYLDDLRRKLGLADRDAALRKLKSKLGDHELSIRRFLSGTLRDEMIRILGDTKRNRHRVYGALYELEDEELISALGRLGSHARIVLANGSVQKKKGQSAAQARKGDQNRKARATLKRDRVQVHNRMISPGALGHNKFLVITDARDKPLAAWTGSTNWTRTGLCTQINNGLLIRNRQLAQIYFDQWKRLRDAKSGFPTALVSSNGKPSRVTWGSSRAEVWFTRTKGGPDLKAIEDVLSKAQHAVLFLMFQPGGKGTLATVRKMLASPGGLYIKGVVSTLPPASPDDAPSVDVSVFGDDERHRVELDIVQPKGLRTPFASWAETVSRQSFLNNVGWAIVHSKLIVVDPFTRPVVITGSHNFSSAASSKNDENFLIIRGNQSLAAKYAAHILAVYQHYRWLAVVNSMQARGRNPSGLLFEDDTWQARHWKRASRKEIEFWTP